MSEPAIRIRNLGKRYRLGMYQSWDRTLREAACDKLGRLFGRRSSRPAGGQSWFWALRDLSLDVQPGEVVGIIGRNGAGKSTLLKILSRITDPSTGYADLNGRVGSLLEVGSGFHPELTGRENIYLNGTVLGMRKREIDAKFDDIVDFSGISAFLDTPVKRYSSGMRVRLAFAVAAHLDPEILIVDEVLAVGDAQFQKRCVGKMRDVATGQGRTVLFVSHNMSMIESLCDRCILIEDGRLQLDAAPQAVIRTYLQDNEDTNGSRDLTDPELPRDGSGEARFQHVEVLTIQDDTRSVIRMGDGLSFRMRISSHQAIDRAVVGVGIFNERGVRICGLNSDHTGGWTVALSPGETRIVECRLPDVNLAANCYVVSLQLKDSCSGYIYDYITQAVAFDITPADVYGTGHISAGNNIIFLKPTWSELSPRNNLALTGTG